jgi:hypothetical protein
VAADNRGRSVRNDPNPDRRRLDLLQAEIFGKFNDDSHLDLVTLETSGKVRLYPGT